MTETLTNTTFVVGDRLPWPDESSPVHEKGPFDSGVLIDSETQTPCKIRKISALGATLIAEQDKTVGSRVALELGNGQRPGATIEWVNRRELGVRFDEAVDVLALINRELVSQPVERRSMPRVELRCAVHLKYGEHFEPAVLRNISALGLQIEAEQLPAVGTYLEVFAEGLNIPAGEVVWRRDNLAGMEMFVELSWTSIIPWVRAVIRNGGN